MDSYRAIENLIYEYAERIDSGDFEGVAELFRDAEIVAPASTQPVRGVDAVLAMYNGATRRYADGTPRSRHLVTNVAIEVDEEASRASARSYFTVLQATEGLPLQPIIAGSYRDEFLRREGRWRFKRREMLPQLLGDLSQHLLFDAGALNTDKT